MGRQRCLPARRLKIRSVPGLQRPHLYCALVPVAVLLLAAALWLGRDLVLARPGPDASPGGAPVQAGALAVGDPLPRIQCTYGYTASLYAQGLSSPDGLAFSPAGLLYVAEEGAGRVSRVGPGGSVTPAISGLTHPEGIAFDGVGILYVVEDTQAGRLIRAPLGGAATILAAGLDAPEGIVWTAGGTMYVTESNMQFAVNPLGLETGITAVSPSGVVTRVLTNTLAFDGARPLFWSYAGLARGPDGLLYASNEMSGLAVTRTVTVGSYVYTLTLSTTDSIFAVDPAAGTRALFASGLVAPEGLHFSTNGDFPLYVAEEDVGSGEGRLSRVERNGSHYTLCTGFLAIEDVVMDAEGRLYVSEDGSGSIILLRPGHRLWLPVVTRKK